MISTSCRSLRALAWVTTAPAVPPRSCTVEIRNAILTRRPPVVPTSTASGVQRRVTSGSGSGGSAVADIGRSSALPERTTSASPTRKVAVRPTARSGRVVSSRVPLVSGSSATRCPSTRSSARSASVSSLSSTPASVPVNPSTATLGASRSRRITSPSSPGTMLNCQRRSRVGGVASPGPWGATAPLVTGRPSASSCSSTWSASTSASAAAIGNGSASSSRSSAPSRRSTSGPSPWTSSHRCSPSISRA